MWSWLSVALSGFISISASESNQNKQAAAFKTLSMVMLVVMLWSQGTSLGLSAWWITLGLLISLLADNLYILNKQKNSVLPLTLPVSFVTALLLDTTFR